MKLHRVSISTVASMLLASSKSSENWRRNIPSTFHSSTLLILLRCFRRDTYRGRPSSKFSICMGMFMSPSRPSNGVLLPSKILAIPNKMGYFKSSRYPLHSFSINRTTARAVSTPSATSLVDSNISAMVSPFPRRYPNCRFLDRGPKQVPKVSPTPAHWIKQIGVGTKHSKPDQYETRFWANNSVVL